MRYLLALAILWAAGPPETGSAQEKGKVRKVKIKSIEGLRFDPVRFTAKRGETLEITLENHDPNDQPHNFVLSKPGSLQEIQTASMVIGPDSAEKGFVPEHDAILAKSKMLNPEQKDVISFNVPEEKGVYPYICTFPGHALVMYGALYVDTRVTEDLPFDLNVPEMVRVAELEKLKAKMEVERPAMLRLFMPDAGPAAIAVALPEGMNYCWDAGNCRLRYAWSGGFVDATKMWNSNGNALAKILGETFWKSQPGETLHGVQFGQRPPQYVKFRGYELIGGLPVFEYEVDGVAVRESLRSGPKGLEWSFKIDSPPADVHVIAPEFEGATMTGSAGARDLEFWTINKAQASEFTLTISPK